ncbi:MAG: STAS domain-containing protein [Prolixibacteraceae bacterium]
MELHSEKIGKYLVVKASGRLDATWADYFTDTFLTYIRNGEHEMVIEAAGLDFLSSAGIRSLVRVYKELAFVKGSFIIVNATEFVAGTLITTGFGNWLSDSLPDDLVLTAELTETNKSSSAESYKIKGSGGLEIKLINGWQDWKEIDETAIQVIKFHPDIFSLGIGSTSADIRKARNQFGEMMAVGGNVIFQVPEEHGHPDYLLAVNEFVPEMTVLNALVCRGEMSGMFRFAPTANNSALTISEISEQVLSNASSSVAGFVVIAEIGGLVGANLIQSPGKIGNQPVEDLSEVRDWLSYSGEKVFSGEQAILFGVVAKASKIKNSNLLKPLPSNPALAGHMHVAVFPFQPIPNGQLDLKLQTDKFFAGPPPLALIHLIDDDRPLIGLGESSFIRGACWFAPINNKEEVL